MESTEKCVNRLNRKKRKTPAAQNAKVRRGEGTKLKWVKRLLMATPLARELTAVNAHSMAGEELKPFFLTERTTNMMREKRRTAPPILTPTYLSATKGKGALQRAQRPKRENTRPR